VGGVTDRRSLENRRVYVIDDDSAVLESMAYLLDAYGHSCATFASADEFLAELNGLAPGCVITDLQMPGTDGCQLLSAMRARSIGWPVCLMSSSTRGLKTRARGHGFLAFLAKPVQNEELVAALDRAVQLLPASQSVS
jgi:FixJ family two-component response regulator